MRVRLMNMIKIYNEKTKEVLVLDKVKKEGWEGLTFPGGKVETFESFEQSVIREAKEETNLKIKNPQLVGIITWIGRDYKDIGLLYQTNEFEGELVSDNREGKLFWVSYDKFKAMDNKSMSMDKILSIYEGKYREVFWDFRIDNQKISYY